MNAPSPIDRDHAAISGLGSRLTGIYVRTFLWFLLAVYALWQVGLEGIYENITPFYALYLPQFTSIFVPSIMGLLGGATYLAWSQPFIHRRPGRLAAAWIVWLAVALVLCAAWIAESHRNGQSPAMAAAAHGLLLSRHVLALALFVGFYATIWAVLRRLNWPDAALSPRAAGWLLVALIAFAFVFSGAVASMRIGVDGIAQAYGRHGYEYIDDIGRGRTIQGLFRDYIKMLPYLSMHAKVHPPGPIAVLWLLSFVAGRNPMGLSLATMAVGTLTLVPLYFWVRDVSGSRAALTACLLYPLMPTYALFTATSADILFMPFTVTTLFLFWRAIHRSPARYAFAAGVGYGLMSILSFSLLTVGAFFGLVGLWRLRSPERRAAVVQTAVLMIAGFLVFHGALRWWSGFDIVACFHTNLGQFNTDQFNLEQITPRFPAWAWRFVNPFAILFFAGIPVAVLGYLAVRHAAPDARARVNVLALTFAITVLLYLARGEGERSAMYTLPFVLVPAADILVRFMREARSLSPLLATAACLAAQTWFIESYFYTYW